MADSAAEDKKHVDFDKEKEPKQFSDDICRSFEDSFAEFRMTKNIDKFLALPPGQQEAYAKGVEKNGSDIVNYLNLDWRENTYDKGRFKSQGAELEIKSNCDGEPKTIKVSDRRQIDTETGWQHVSHNNKSWQQKELQNPGVDERIQDALTLELKTNYPNIDASTEKSLRTILDVSSRGGDRKPYVSIAAQVQDYREMAKEVLQDPQSAKNAVEILNKLIPGQMFEIKNDSARGWTFNLNPADGINLALDKNGAVVDGKYFDHNAADGVIPRWSNWQTSDEVKAWQESAIEIASYAIHTRMSGNRNSIVGKLEAKEESVSKEFKSQIDEHVPTAEEIYEVSKLTHTEKWAEMIHDYVKKHEVTSLAIGDITPDDLKKPLPSFEPFFETAVTRRDLRKAHELKAKNVPSGDLVKDYEGLSISDRPGDTLDGKWDRDHIAKVYRKLEEQAKKHSAND